MTTSFQNKLLDWFDTHQRDLPWRHTYDPYHVWISEVMLQQTQMSRGVEYFTRWVERFPNIDSVAAASEEEILKLWEGLGYYSRARNLHKAAQHIAVEYNGMLPESYDLLLGLPGIGNYTAAAIMSLAFNRNFPLVDANVERVFARFFNLPEPIKSKTARVFIWKKAEELLPRGKARAFNQALMELGALVCLPQRPECPDCPVRGHCESLQLGVTDERPVLPRPPKAIRIEMCTGILIHDRKIFIQKRRENDVWANLWEFPGGRLQEGETPESAVVREYCEETGFAVGNLEKIALIRHSYTKYRVILHCYFCRLQNGSTEPVLHAAQAYRWVDYSELSQYAFPAGHRKLLEKYGTSLHERASGS